MQHYPKRPRETLKLHSFRPRPLKLKLPNSEFTDAAARDAECECEPANIIIKALYSKTKEIFGDIPLCGSHNHNHKDVVDSSTQAAPRAVEIQEENKDENDR